MKCHKIYKDDRESLNKRLLPESYFIRNMLVRSDESLSMLNTGFVVGDIS